LTNPLFYLLLVLALASMVAIPVWSRDGRHAWAFLASSTAIAAQTGLAGLSLFPRLVPSSIDLEGASMTIHNASSSARTLTVMLVIAGVGMPIVIGYTAFIYRVFKGRISPGQFYGSHGPGGH